MRFDKDLHYICQHMGKWHVNFDVEGRGRFCYDDDAPKDIKDAIDRLDERLEMERTKTSDNEHD